MKSILKNKLFMVLYSLMKLPTPVNISILWNLGSMLGVCLMIQIISGLLLTMHYCPNVNMAFNSVIHIVQDVKLGWLIRNFHMNGASLYFICMYIHVGRGLYYNSFKLKKVWFMGVIILFISMATAFLGYVLPWGQMSFWGATVITNLLSAIPYFGSDMVNWLWGGFSINNATLNRFYTFHFILPFIILIMVIMHLMFLHETGSSNPLGLNSDLYKVSFYPYFMYKDMVGFIYLLIMFLILITQYPYLLSDPDNFIPANSMVTPIHIQPEWYFLFAYAILRSIPNKLGGVIALVMSILMLLYFLLFSNFMFDSNKFYPLNQIMFYLFILSFFILTWIGAKPIEYPYVQISQFISILYFMYFFLLPIISNYWDNLIFKN